MTVRYGGRGEPSLNFKQKESLKKTNIVPIDLFCMRIKEGPTMHYDS